ncbi:hypothetical protein MKW94_029594 [Papaver nudicaule]|uniref:Chlororespiratory reduction 4 n=1 Tax=Papaver nudicaule TaxID=74823 RepID=A0AA41VY29_PAPNU|nr:hypothetical protein [Papaver nudicaule]MCL7049548.1 hypothetical protein [Papaver nudicaule]
MFTVYTNQPYNSTLHLLKKCRNSRDLNQIHARILTSGLIKNSSLTSKIILNFASSSHQPLVEFSRYIFFSQQKTNCNPFLWNLIIKSFSHGVDPEQAILVFISMLSQGSVYPDTFSFSLVLKACSRLELIKEGLQIHCLILKGEFGSNVFLQNSLINLYLKCGCIEFARLMFDKMLKRDSVSWNLMIDGYVKNDMMENALEVFHRMPIEDQNLITWNSMISGYSKFEDGFEFAWGLFNKMPERDLVSWNSMINGCLKCGKLGIAGDLFNLMPERDSISWASMLDGYAKFGDIDKARNLFDQIPDSRRDTVTWNAMIDGYIHNGCSKEALELFHEMWKGSSLVPDQATLAMALSAIAELGYISEGASIHDYIERKGLDLNGKLGVAVIDMYSKCGSINNAMWVFEKLERKNVDHWNSMINGLAIHGLGDLAFDLLMEMERVSIKPDDITFIGVLNACAHSGMVKEGLICFELMRRVYGLSPKLQHYGCIVDLLGRAGFLKCARNFIEEMPIEPNDVIWRTLLSSCMKHENFGMGIEVADNLIDLDSRKPSSYVLLSNIYAGSGMWDDVNRVRMMMKDRNIRKVPGCSWIELDGNVHEFVIGDTSHPEFREIYSVLDKLCPFNS